MPRSAHVPVRDGYQCDDDFANDDGDNCLPDGNTGGNEGPAELPVRESNLIDSPERYEAEIVN